MVGLDHSRWRAVAATATLPAVTFDGLPSQNRVSSTADAYAAMYKRRVGQIYTETGGLIESRTPRWKCRAEAVPTVDNNPARCFPAIWGASRAEDWFRKYVVSQVVESDLTGGNPPTTTTYDYDVVSPGWHHGDDELIQEGRRAGRWRAYQKVRVRTGEAGTPLTLTEYPVHAGHGR